MPCLYIFKDTNINKTPRLIATLLFVYSLVRSRMIGVDHEIKIRVGIACKRIPQLAGGVLLIMLKYFEGEILVPKR